MAPADRDRFVRLAAFQWLKSQTDLHGEVLAIDVLRQGFILDGQRVPFMAPQGIFKPAVLPDAPLSITTVPRSRRPGTGPMRTR